MTTGLQGKVAIVTGGTSGIGRDTAVLFAEKGLKVAVAGRREAEGNETVELIHTAGGEGFFLKTDVGKTTDVQALIGKTVEKYGKVDVAFNNAGIEGTWSPLAEQTEEDFDATMATNLKGVWLCLKYELQQMLRQGTGGAIVNMSSVAGLMGAAGAGTYVASKHGVIGLTRTAALEMSRHGIRVNAVCPAVIDTPMGDRIFGAMRPETEALHPIGRYGTPREVSEAVLWMCSDGAGFMTGHYMVLDGGLLTGPNPNR